jgi:hypothetical protein
MSDIPPTTMTLAGHLDDRRASLVATGFRTDLWVHEFGWEPHTEDEVAKDVYPAQLLAAYECFQWLFSATEKRVWVHLAAEMQAGKTGVVTALVRLLLSNVGTLRIRPNGIFVLTGMGDNSWRTQTRERLPVGIRPNVQHNKGLHKVVSQLQRMAGGEYLSNVLIVVDESHIAHNAANRPSLIYREVARLCPMEMWQERNIRFLTISATDPAKVLAQGDARIEYPCKTVRLLTDEAYQSVSALREARRIRYIENFGSLTSATGIGELKRAVTSEFADAPRYHLLRAPHRKQSELKTALELHFPDADILCFDAMNRPLAAGGGGGSDDGSDVTMEDINELLSVAPEKHTFILLKNMFYAAKTLNDTHVGILYDRSSGKDDTNLQSLLGRACGYGKSKRTIVYTSRQTVENYEGCWRALCGIDGAAESHEMATALRAATATADPKKLQGRMANVVATTEGLAAASAAMTPMGAGLGAAAAEPIPQRVRVNQDNFESEWSEWFRTEEEAISWWRAKGGRTQPLKKDAEGYYLCSADKGPERLRAAKIEAWRGGNKTAGMPSANKMDVGKTQCRRFAAYLDLTDPTSVRFCVHYVKRVM